MTNAGKTKVERYLTTALGTMTDQAAIYALDELTLGTRSRTDFLTKTIQSGHCVVTKIGSTVVGFAVADQSFFDQTFMRLLIVHPGHRRKGIATALIRHIEGTCPTEKFFTSTNASNVPMRRLCEALGFVKSGIIENLDEGDPEIIYFKRLPTRLELRSLASDSGREES